ncbi:hypothetical protein Q8791_25030 [Nocardiopsis sp. CT-R113]|uniref:Uncharacterized protein n=1 Tax=Nocardiopsis codii TaxID=3065942 RepID=A0ABU7KE30_9ACTN|nr:hypothetical protein [Nocardiopsis sp. CT-R113]MEE2040490.1 hypothetical protein [Nocardiopsis sp. CT-R113]
MPISPSSPSVVLSAAVMSHPDRRACAQRVLDALALPGAALALDPDPDGPPSSLRSSQVAFSLAGAAESTHHLVLQDDVRLSDDFLESVRSAVESHPDAALALFVEWGSRTACLARWAVFAGAGAVPVINPYMPTLGMVLPRELAVEMGAFMQGADGRSDDRAALAFLRGRGIRTLATVPNLVEHRELASLKGNGEHGARHAVCFAREGARFGAEVLEVPPLLPFLRWNTGTAVAVDPADDVPESHRPLLEVLVEWGATEPELRREFREGGFPGAVGEIAADGASAGEGADPLFDTWLTAVACGAVQERHWPGTVAWLRDRWDEPWVVRALGTFAPGALRLFADTERLVARAEESAPAVLAAMEYGTRFEGVGPPARPAGKPVVPHGPRP